MDKRTIEILDIIKKFIFALESNNIKINRAILFGSFAKGNSNEWSDIDVALVSDAFIGKRFIDREKIRKYKLKLIIKFPLFHSEPKISMNLIIL